MNTSAHPAAQPWYRQPWPWFFLGVPALTIIAGAVTMWFAITTNDGLVADDYYKQGLGINKQLARSERALAMGLHGSVRVSQRGVELMLEAKPGEVLPQRVRVVFSHPTRVGQDRKLVLNNNGRTWHGELEPLPPGRWFVSIEDEAATWRLDATAHFPEDREVKLDAGSFRSVD